MWWNCNICDYVLLYLQAFTTTIYNICDYVLLYLQIFTTTVYLIRRFYHFNKGSESYTWSFLSTIPWAQGPKGAHSKTHLRTRGPRWHIDAERGPPVQRGSRQRETKTYKIIDQKRNEFPNVRSVYRVIEGSECLPSDLVKLNTKWSFSFHFFFA